MRYPIPMPRQAAHQTKPNAEKNKRRDPTAAGNRDAAVNRIASHNYFLLEKFETGVVLSGTEVKSVREGLTNLKDSYGLVKDGELWLLNCHIGPYQHGNIFNHAPLRTRKLLMHKEEIRKLIGKTQQRGLTLIPTRMYFKNGKVKVEIALAKGKQLWDKRETERRRTADNEAREAISRSRKAQTYSPFPAALIHLHAKPTNHLDCNSIIGAVSLRKFETQSATRLRWMVPDAHCRLGTAAAQFERSIWRRRANT